MLDKLFSKDYKRILYNFLSLIILQGANYLLPLITIPYLLRVIGPEKFGVIAFAQAFIQYFIVFVDYGFNLSATKEISINRESKDKLSEIFSSVFIIKVILIFVAFLIILFFIEFIDKFKQEKLIYILFFGVILGQGLFPIWFFQGIEKMKYITFISILSKALSTLTIFFFIKEEKDYLYVPFFYSIGFIVATILSFLIIFYKFNIRLKLVKFQTVLNYFKESSSFFLSRISVVFYSSSNSILIGFLWGYQNVAYFDVASKIINALRQPWDLLNTVVYPYMTKEKNINFIKKIIIISFSAAIFITSLIFIYSDFIVEIIIGHYSKQASYMLKVLSLIIPLISIHIFLGGPILVSFGYEKYFNLSNILGLIWYIFAISVLYITSNLTIEYLLYTIVSIDMFILLYRFYSVKYFKILT